MSHSKDRIAGQSSIECLHKWESGKGISKNPDVGIINVYDYKGKDTRMAIRGMTEKF